MALVSDCWGNDWTTANPEAVVAIDRCLLSYLGMRVDIGDHLKAVFSADPEMVFAHILKGYFAKFFAAAEMERRAAKTAEAARMIADQNAITQQEQLHLQALEQWVRGHMGASIQCWERILIDHPRDVMAVKLVQHFQFYLGDGAAMRDNLARVLFAWDEDTPGFGFMLGCYAFGLEEAGAYKKAEETGRRAVEINPADVWSAHAVAHVLEMQGRSRDGEAFLSALEPNWEKIHNFKHHAQWHRALFMLDLGQYDQVLQHYDAKVWTDIAGDYLDISNGVALLWRLMEEGVDVGDRWRVLAELAADRTDENILVFADLHFFAALVNAGESDRPKAMRQSMEVFAAKSETQSRVMQDVGLAIADAFMAVDRGEHARAVDLLLPKRADIRLIGGSHAQRDFFDRFLIRAALSAGKHSVARHLLAERIENRPSARWNWMRLADVLTKEGKLDEAAMARAETERLLAA